MSSARQQKVVCTMFCTSMNANFHICISWFLFNKGKACIKDTNISNLDGSTREPNIQVFPTAV